MKTLLFIITATLFAQSLLAQSDPNNMSNMCEYYFVELMEIPDRPKLDSITTTKIQVAHLNNIDSLHTSGKLVLAGPFGDDKGGGLF